MFTIQGHHDHGHHHGKLPIVLYIIGVFSALIALVLNDQFEHLQNFLFMVSMIAAGYHVVVLEGISETIENTKNCGRFTPNAHILMGLAALGASLIGEFWEGALLILIFSGAHFLEDYAENKSKKEITKLVEMNPTKARRILTSGDIEIVDVSHLKVGDYVQVKNGDQVPIDGVLLTGETYIDESSINGEAIAKEKTKGDPVYASTINGTGTFTMKVTKESDDTVFSKILKLVDQRDQVKVGSIINRFEPKYVRLVLIAVPLFVVLAPLLFGWTWPESIYRGLVLLVAASPCALAAATVSVTLSTSSNLAKNGVLSKGSSCLSQLANAKAIAFDKTGTLTKGKPEVTNVYFVNKVNERELIDIVVALEKDSNHPLADAILEKFDVQTPLNIQGTNQIGKGIVGEYKGKHYRIGKPTTFKNVKKEITHLNSKWASDGKTVIYIAENEEVIGLIGLVDVLNERAQSTICYFKKQGLHTTLITGDSKMTGQAVADQLNIDEVIANVLPEDKSTILTSLKKKYGETVMVGDGVNDAPALVNADVGIAMGEGTDVAIDVSDIVLMKNDLSRLVQTHRTSQKMNRVIWENILFSMSVVIFLVTITFLGLTGMTLSVIIHEGSTLIVILNGLRLLRSV